MKYDVIRNGQACYVYYSSREEPIKAEKDAVSLVSACGENDTQLLMVHASALSDDFFRLRTGVAGDILQKFANYHLKVACVIPAEMRVQGKFQEFLLETNRGSFFRSFETVPDAANWLFEIR